MNISKYLSQSNKQALRNPWVLGWLAMVSIVLAVNIGMITTAVVTNPGLVNEDYYEQGRSYEKNVLKQIAARNALGWQVSLEVPELTPLAAPAPYRFTAVDDRGLPLGGAEVVLMAYRPSDAKADFRVPLLETAPGQYQAQVEFPLKGIWDLIIQVKRGEDHYDMARRISVRG